MEISLKLDIRASRRVTASNELWGVSLYSVTVTWTFQGVRLWINSEQDSEKYMRWPRVRAEPSCCYVGYEYFSWNTSSILICTILLAWCLSVSVPLSVNAPHDFFSFENVHTFSTTESFETIEGLKLPAVKPFEVAFVPLSARRGSWLAKLSLFRCQNPNKHSLMIV